MLNYKRLWRLLHGSALLYACAVAATGFAAALTLAVPLVVRFAVDTVIGGAKPDFALAPEGVGLFACAAAIVLLTATQGVFTYFRARWSSVASERIAKDMKDRLYDHIQKLPYEYHVKAQAGDLIQRCTSDVETVRRFLSAQLIELGRILFMVGLSVFFMARLHVGLTLCAVAIMPPVIAFSIWFSFRIGKSFLKADEKEAELTTVLNENLSGVRVVRAFGREAFETEKFEAKNSEYRGLVRKLIVDMAVFWAASDGMCMTQIGVVLLYGVHLSNAGAISLGTLLVFITYVNMLIWPIRGLGRILSDMSKMGVSLGRVAEILETPQEGADETPGGQLTPSLTGDIVFEDVWFGYGKDAPIIKGMSFTVKSGETIAILGGTGSGKSTVMHLLLRLYDYGRGSIRIGGTELKRIERKWLRERVGIVLQEPFLYSKSIMENIRMAEGAEGRVDDADIYEAAKTAAVHDVVTGFDEGYGTLVGEKGVTLSGGQKQRIAIARTLIKNSDILIFDDSLSNLDTETDLKIRAALKKRRSAATTFIISQRLTTLMDASRIFVIEGGKIADSGTHDELIARGGLYSRIWKIQNLEDC